MQSLQLFALKSTSVIKWGDDIVEHFLNSLEYENFKLEADDIVVISSKVFSMKQNSAIKISEVKPSKLAIKLGNEANLNPKIAELVIKESNNEIFGAVFHAILAKTPYGLSANAGIDLSNSPDGYALLLPKNPDDEALKFKNALTEKLHLDVAILIIDSRTIPLRKGTFAVALGIAGMEPIKDERGKKDLYGNKMVITTRAIADNIATAANLIMGETNEQTPFGIIRGLKYTKSKNVTMQSTLMPEDQCLYFAPFMKYFDRGDKK